MIIRVFNYRVLSLYPLSVFLIIKQTKEKYHIDYKSVLFFSAFTAGICMWHSSLYDATGKYVYEGVVER